MSTLPPELGALAGCYEDLDEIGRGGMATVFRARDCKHDRIVALKLLRADLAASIGAERFLKEIAIVARLSHPHILPLHDSGQSNGRLWYVMPWVAGGSLRGHLDVAAPLPLEAALALARPVADALTYAHGSGIVHRDVKPENILLQHGLPVVADFGIARAVSSAGGAALTRTGFPVGTPGYMSPEQAAGLTDLDARTDVYALAVVVYELLVGEIPAGWLSEDAVRAGRFLDAPPHHRAILDALPGHVEAALTHALAVRADRRTATAAALIGELSHPGARRRFSDDEVREILRRAAEADAAQPTLDGSLTLGGVEQAAAGAGIPAPLVRQAAARIAAAPATPTVVVTATQIVTETTVTGELDDTDLGELVGELRRIAADPGTVERFPGSVSWSSSRGPAYPAATIVTVSSRDGRTRIVVQSNLGADRDRINLAIGGSMTAGGLAVVAALAGVPWLAVASVPAWGTGMWATLRHLHRSAQRKRRDSDRNLLGHLAELATRLVDAGRRRGGGTGKPNPLTDNS